MVEGSARPRGRRAALLAATQEGLARIAPAAGPLGEPRVVPCRRPSGSGARRLDALAAAGNGSGWATGGASFASPTGPRATCPCRMECRPAGSARSSPRARTPARRWRTEAWPVYSVAAVRRFPELPLAGRGRVFDLARGPDGRIWATTVDGVVRFALGRGEPPVDPIPTTELGGPAVR